MLTKSDLMTFKTQINTMIGHMLEKIEENEENSPLGILTEETRGDYENIYPLAAEPSIFKGQKPTGLIFGENDRVDVSSWKMVVEKIMKRCDADPEKHAMLMDLRGKVSGRNRVLLAKEIGKMRSPVKIAENLYVETHYDTETLLRILTTRILRVVGYDYTRINVALRNEH